MKLNHRNIISLPLMGMMALSVSGNEKIKQPEQPSVRPNIIIIVPDDLGWNDVGYHGSEIGRASCRERV